MKNVVQHFEYELFAHSLIDTLSENLGGNNLANASECAYKTANICECEYFAVGFCAYFANVYIVLCGHLQGPVQTFVFVGAYTM